MGIFVDLKKALDRVDHTYLLKKLDYYGIQGVSNDFLESYRLQSVFLCNTQSHDEEIICGIPQVLFHIYMNNIVNV